MRDITVLRVEADSGVVGRVLGKLPGVEVVDSPVAFDDEDAPVDERDEQPAPDVPDEQLSADDDSGGLVGRVTPEAEELDGDKASLVREYGLLGAGVTLVFAGLASVGAWVFQRRGDGEAETPPPATEFEPATTESETPAPSGPTGETDAVGPATGEQEPTPSESEATADESDAAETEPEAPGRVEGDRSGVEWTTREHTETRTEFDTGTEEEADSEEPEPRPGESLDPAPLLGMAFIAVSGALVRWLRGTDDEAQGPTG